MKIDKTDTELLDWLEEQNNFARYTGRCIFRWSSNGRGWRLHETSSQANSSATVREAIRAAMLRERKYTLDEIAPS